MRIQADYVITARTSQTVLLMAESKAAVLNVTMQKIHGKKD